MLANSPIAATLPVVNLERARAFYEGTLGLPLNEDLSSETALAFVCGNGTYVVIYERRTPTKADHTAATWLVPDIEDVVSQLNAQGIEFEQYDTPDIKTDSRGIAELGPMRGGWFKDPEDNILGIFQAGN